MSKSWIRNCRCWCREREAWLFCRGTPCCVWISPIRDIHLLDGCLCFIRFQQEFRNIRVLKEYAQPESWCLVASLAAWPNPTSRHYFCGTCRYCRMARFCSRLVRLTCFMILVRLRLHLSKFQGFVVVLSPVSLLSVWSHLSLMIIMVGKIARSNLLCNIVFSIIPSAID